MSYTSNIKLASAILKILFSDLSINPPNLTINLLFNKHKVGLWVG